MLKLQVNRTNKIFGQSENFLCSLGPRNEFRKFRNIIKLVEYLVNYYPSQDCLTMGVIILIFCEKNYRHLSGVILEALETIL